MNLQDLLNRLKSFLPGVFKRDLSGILAEFTKTQDRLNVFITENSKDIQREQALIDEKKRAQLRAKKVEANITKFLGE